MVAVSVPVYWSATNKSSKHGPFQDSNGDLWVVGGAVASSGSDLRVAKSSDGGATWSTTYDTSGQGLANAGASVCDAIFDETNGVIYVVTTYAASQPLRIYSFTISNTTWARVDSGTGPQCFMDGANIYEAFLTRRSTGEFVVCYQGPTHSSMGSSYRSVYYARCSSAGTWSSGVEVDAGGQVNFDCKGACLGASDRIHMIYGNGNVNLLHRSLSSANAFGETPGAVISDFAGPSISYWGIYYNSTLGKLVVGMSQGSAVVRADSQAGPSWSGDSNTPGNGDFQGCGPAFIYEPTDAKLYVFYRDYTSNDLYQNSALASGTTWGTRAVQDGTTIGADGTNTGGVYTFYGDGGNWERVAQTVIPASTISISRVSFKLKKIGTPTDNVVCELYQGSDDSGTLLASSTVVGSSLLTSGSYIGFDFGSSQTLQSGTTYCFVFRRTGSWNSSNRYEVFYSSSAYAAGNAGIRNNGVWSFPASGYANSDLAFGIPDSPLITVTGISVGLITDAIGVVFNDSSVYFDKLVLVAPPEPIPPVTTQEEFFALL